MQKQILSRQLYKKWYFYLILVGILAIGIVTAIYIQNTNNKTDDDQTKIVVTQSDPAYITYTAIAGNTSLEQLKKVNQSVKTETSEYGEYVNSIGSLVGGTDGSYWSFYVDGEMASVGAGSYVQKGGEKIEWKFQNLSQ